MDSGELSRVDAASAVVATRMTTAPEIGIVLVSGLGSIGHSLASRIPYRDLPGMPLSTVAGHAGNLCLGTLGGTSVACLQGRVHLYEGHDPASVVFGVRLLARLGCHTVFLTNASGAIAPWLTAGDLMIITDHLNLTGKNPLIGPNDPSVGPRFFEMTSAYDPDLAKLARSAAQELGIPVREGTYAGLLGPSYETPAEIRMLRTLGADAVGMSTVLEVIALRHLGVRVGAITCATNMAAGIGGSAPTHDAEVV
jgi:purine-nucleoside phosphorylase